MSDRPVATEIKNGAGWAAAPLEALGEGWGFRKIRAGLGVTAFGVNAIVLPPRYQAGVHYHDEQEELYLVHAGDVELEFGEGDDVEVVRLGAGGLARVAAATRRRLRNVGHDDAVVVIVGERVSAVPSACVTTFLWGKSATSSGASLPSSSSAAIRVSWAPSGRTNIMP